MKVEEIALPKKTTEASRGLRRDRAERGPKGALGKVAWEKRSSKRGTKGKGEGNRPFWKAIPAASKKMQGEGIKKGEFSEPERNP